MYYFEESVNIHNVDAEWLEHGISAVEFSRVAGDDVYQKSFCKSGPVDIVDILRSEDDYMSMWGFAYHLVYNQPELLQKIIHSVHVGMPAHPQWVARMVDTDWQEQLCEGVTP